MKKKKIKCFKAGAFSVICFICISCSTQSKYEKLSVGDKDSNQSFLDPNLKILLLPPQVDYESISNEMKLDYGQSKETLEKFLESQTLMELKSKGLQIKNTTEFTAMPATFNEELIKLTNNSDQMFKGYLEEVLKQNIESFGNKYNSV